MGQQAYRARYVRSLDAPWHRAGRPGLTDGDVALIKATAPVRRTPAFAPGDRVAFEAGGAPRTGAVRQHVGNGWYYVTVDGEQWPYMAAESTLTADFPRLTWVQVYGYRMLLRWAYLYLLAINGLPGVRRDVRTEVNHAVVTIESQIRQLRELRNRNNAGFPIPRFYRENVDHSHECLEDLGLCEWWLEDYHQVMLKRLEPNAVATIANGTEPGLHKHWYKINHQRRVEAGVQLFITQWAPPQPVKERMPQQLPLLPAA